MDCFGACVRLFNAKDDAGSLGELKADIEKLDADLNMLGMLLSPLLADPLLILEACLVLVGGLARPSQRDSEINVLQKTSSCHSCTP